jgi:hypothetical protein
MLRPLRHPGALTLGVLLVLAPPARAQYSEAQPGARVRIQAPGILAGPFVGTVLAREGGIVRVGSPSMQPLDIPLDRITSFEISRGKSRWAGAGRGAVIGVPIGLALGLLSASVASDEDRAYSDGARRDTLSRGEVVAYTTLGSMFWGAVIGAFIPQEKWDRFAMAPRTGFDDRRRRVQLGLSLAY